MAKPILFSTEMIKSILSGKKTQTRRLTNLDEVNSYHHHWEIFPTYKLAYKIHDCMDGVCATFTPTHFEHGKVTQDESVRAKFPYGDIGTFLWVREAYAKDYFETGKHGYKADYTDLSAEYVSKPKWKPSIHMPKTATRILLEIENIRIARLQDINNDDAFAEGIDWKIKYPDEAPDSKFYRDYERSINSYSAGILFQAKHSFFSLWKSINGRDSFQQNPFVWVIEFKKCGEEKLNLFKTGLTTNVQSERHSSAF